MRDIGYYENILNLPPLEFRILFEKLNYTNTMVDIETFTTTISYVGKIDLFESIQAGEPADKLMYSSGKYELAEILLCEEEQVIAQMQTGISAMHGVDYGDMLIIHPQLNRKVKDLVYIKRNHKKQVVPYLQLLPTDTILGGITRIIKYLRAPRSIHSNLRRFPEKVILPKREYSDFDIVNYLTRRGKETILIKVRGSSMIQVGIEEGDLVIFAPEIEYRNYDIVAANYGAGYTIKVIQFDSEDANKATLSPRSEGYQSKSIHLNYTKIAATAIAVIKLHRPLLY